MKYHFYHEKRYFFFVSFCVSMKWNEIYSFKNIATGHTVLNNIDTSIRKWNHNDKNENWRNKKNENENRKKERRKKKNFNEGTKRNEIFFGFFLNKKKKPEELKMKILILFYIKEKKNFCRFQWVFCWEWRKNEEKKKNRRSMLH